MASVTPYCCWLGKHLCECWNLCAYDELPAFARLKEATSDRGVLLACLAQGDKVNWSFVVGTWKEVEMELK